MDVHVDFDDPPEPDRRTRQVLGWRREQFERMGFDSIDSDTLAKRKDIEIHLVARMLDEGCSHSVALEIVL